MTSRLTPTIVRICKQVELARTLLDKSLAKTAQTTGMTPSRYNAIRNQSGVLRLHNLHLMAVSMGLGGLTYVNSPDTLSDHFKNIHALLKYAELYQQRRDIRQARLRAESRFLFQQLNMGHRILRSEAVSRMANALDVMAVELDVKARIIGLGGLRLQNTIIPAGVGREAQDLDALVPVQPDEVNYQSPFDLPTVPMFPDMAQTGQSHAVDSADMFPDDEDLELDALMRTVESN